MVMCNKTYENSFPLKVSRYEVFTCIKCVIKLH